MTNNPLTSYINKPGVYVRLPSGGRFYDHPPTLTADGDIEVHALTAIDELYLKNPDGLFNNDSLNKVIRNVIPNIPDPSEVVTSDLDVLLVAMRIATYGKDMDVGVKCKKCNHLDNYSIDLMNVLATAKTIPDDNEVELKNGLVIKVKPYTIATKSKISEYTYSIAAIARKFQASSNDQDNEKLRKELAAAINNSSSDLIKLTSASVISITTPDDQVVKEQEYIQEFIEKLDAPSYNMMKDKIAELSNETVNRKFNFTCSECGEDNTGEVGFDPANFFDSSSVNVKQTKT